MLSVLTQPILTMNNSRKLSPSIAPMGPSADVIPEIIANRFSGSQRVAIFNTPTKAKAEPNPTKKRPVAATQKIVVPVNIYVPITHTKHARVNSLFGPYLSSKTPTGNCIGT